MSEESGAGRRLIVRADAVSWRGRVVLVAEDVPDTQPLVQHLIASGASLVASGRTLFSDEGAAGDVEGEMSGMPPALLVVTSYVPDATWAPELLEGARAALPLLELSRDVRSNPRLGLPVVARLASAGMITLRGVHSDARLVAQTALECVDAVLQGSSPAAALGGPSRRDSDRIRLREVVAHPGWLPVAVDRKNKTVRFRHLPRPFYLTNAGRDPRPWDVRLRLDDVYRATSDLSTPAKAVYVYHHGYVGSTLLMRLLDAAGVCLSYDEPSLHFHEYDDAAIRGLFYRTFSGEEVPLIKTVPAEIRNGRRHLAHPAARGVFLYAPVEDYVAATLAHEYRRDYVTRMARNVLRVDCVDPADAAVRCWGWIAEEAIRLASDHKLRTLHADTFFEDPEACLARIHGWFGFPPRTDWGATLARVGALHSKKRRPFTNQNRLAQKAIAAEGARAWLEAHTEVVDEARATLAALARFNV